jgi:hypothetical protein
MKRRRGVHVEDRLQRGRGHAGSHRRDRLGGRDQLAHLTQHPLDVDRLHAQHHQVGLGRHLGVVLEVPHAVLLGQRGGAAGSAVGDQDPAGHVRVGPHPAAHHGG